VKNILTSPRLYWLWRIGWLERAFFYACRALDSGRGTARAFLELWQGFDISYYQGAVNFAKMLAYGARFLVLRVVYAAKKDVRFEEYITAAFGLLPLSVYSFYDPAVAPQTQANAVIDALQPHKGKFRRVWLDFEFWWSGAYSDPKWWKVYRDTIEAAGYATGIYTRATWWDSRVGIYAAEFATRPLWAAQYSSALTLIPKGWKAAMIWQDRVLTNGPQVGVSSPELDHNLWNADFDFSAEWNTAGPAIVIPNGYTQIRRFSSDVHIVKTATFTRAHVTNTGGALRTVSSVAGGAAYAINVDGWDKSKPAPFVPLSVACSDGNLYQPIQFDFRPLFNIRPDGWIEIGHSGFSGSDLYNAGSGTRYLVKAGNNAFDGSTDPEHITERNPRSALGYTANRALILMVVDGRSASSAGVTLHELAELMKQAGAEWALELDGGGSSALWVKDRIVNRPSDPTGERAVVNHLLIYEANMANGTAREKLGNTSTVRSLPTRYGAKLGSVNPYTTVEFTEIVPAQIGGTADNPADKWLKLASGGYVNYILNGAEYYTVLTQPTPETPPAVPDGIEVKITENGVTKTYRTDGKVVVS
jgi:hypothetical protein